MHAEITRSNLFNGRQVFNEMNHLNLKTYPISIHFMAVKVDLFLSFSFIRNGSVNEFDPSGKALENDIGCACSPLQVDNVDCGPQKQQQPMPISKLHHFLMWVCVRATLHTLSCSQSWSFRLRWVYISLSYYMHTNHFNVQINCDFFPSFLESSTETYTPPPPLALLLARILSLASHSTQQSFHFFHQKNAMSSLNEVEKCVSITA